MNKTGVVFLIRARWLGQSFMCGRMRLPGWLQLMFFDLIQSSLPAHAFIALVIYPEGSSCCKWNRSLPGFIAMNITFSHRINLSSSWTRDRCICHLFQSFMFLCTVCDFFAYMRFRVKFLWQSNKYVWLSSFLSSFSNFVRFSGVVKTK